MTLAEDLTTAEQNGLYQTMNHLITEYEQDFYEWTLHNAQLLRDGHLSEIDVVNIAEELESMGKRDKRELICRLTVLIAHLLKWQFQPNMRCKSWQNTIREQRTQMSKVLKDSPSLKRGLHDEGMSEAYPDAVEIAIDETGLPDSIFPETSPYTIEQLLDKRFYPSKFSGLIK